MTAIRYGRFCVLTTVMSASFSNADRTSWASCFRVSGYRQRRYVDVASATVVNWHPAMTIARQFVFHSFQVMLIFSVSTFPMTGVMKSDLSESRSPISKQRVILSVATYQLQARFFAVSRRKHHPKTLSMG